MNRGERASLLANAEPASLSDLAEAILASAEVTVLQEAEVGSLSIVVRDPVEHLRFKPADVLVTRAVVDLEGSPGWAMRMGSDRRAATAAAICDAAAAAGHALALDVDRLCEETARALDAAWREEWAEIVSTIVSFEELDT